MASCVVLLFFLYGVCFQFFPSYGFLLTHNKSSNSMTDQHFTYVMGEIGSDRLKMQKMEQFVLTLQSEMSSLKQELLNLKQSNGNGPSIGNAPSAEMSHLENVILNLKETMNKHLSTDKGLTQSNTQLQQEVLHLQQVTTNIQQTTAQLQQDNSQLKQDNSQLKQTNVHLEKENLLLKTEIDQTRNETLELKLKVNTLLGAVTQLQNNKTQSQDFNLLKTDIQVLHNGTEEIKHILDTLQKSVSMNISSLSKQTDRIYTKVNSVTVTSNSCCQHIQGIFQQLHGSELAIKDLQNATKQTENENQQIKEALKKLSTAQNSTIQRINQVSQKVTLTAYYNGDQITALVPVKFSDIRNSSGITDTNGFKNSGIFRCETSGPYLVSLFVKIPKGSNNAYYLYKNDDNVQKVERISHFNSYSLTQTGIVSLQIGDTISVRITNNLLNPIRLESSSHIIITKLI